MKKKLVSLLMVATMAVSMVACGSSAETPAADATAPAADATATAEAPAAAAADEGKVLNFHCWNTEFQERVVAYYPGYEEVDATTGKIGDVQVNWVITPSDDNAYQNNLDATFEKQLSDSLEDDEKIDIFLIEADYAVKYTGSDATLALADLGLTDDVFAKQYQYTKDVVTFDGKLKGASWQGCPGAMVYRRDIAKEVLGSDDPKDVQAAVANWDKFLETAGTMSDAGYYMTSSANDTFRVFSNNVTTKWVDDNKKIVVDDNIKKWAEMSKEMVANKQTDTFGLWSDDWNKGFYMDGKVFCYFGPAWLIDFCMACDQEGSVGAAGNWGLTEGPQGFFWGGTWICAANGTDNPTLVADIIKTMTTDEAVLTKIITEKSDFVNSIEINDKFAADETFGNAYLGGQNPYGIFSSGVASVDLSNTSAYDQTCNEEFQNAMKEWFDGNYASYDDALASFYEKVVEKQPALSY